MTTEFTPIPTPGELSAPFWSSGLTGTFRLQQCSSCSHLRFPLDAICPRCLSAEYEWAPLSGHGVVQTFVKFHRAYESTWADRVPYIVALIQLDEGPVMISNVVGDDALDVRVGDAVRVVYHRQSADAALPQFERTGR